MAPPRISPRIALVAATLALAACTDSTEPGSITLTIGESGVLRLNQGLTGALPVTVTRSGNVDGPVTLTVSGAPAGVLATLSPASLSDGATTSHLTVTATSSAIPGTYALSVRGTASGVGEAVGAVGLTILPPVFVTVTPSFAFMAPGSTLQLQAAVTGTTNTAVTWESATPSILTVSGTGLATAVGTGSALVIARSVADPNRTAAAQIVVEPVSVRVDPPSLTLMQGRSASLYAAVSGSMDNSVTWQSSAPSIASVNAMGRVTALQPGVATITATSVADPTKSDASTITVVPPPTPITVTSGVPLTGLGAATGTETLYKVVVPAGATRLEIRTSGGTGDVDLVLRHALIPVPSEPLDCGSFGDTTAEVCTIVSPAAGEWFFYLLAYSTYSGVTLTVTVTP